MKQTDPQFKLRIPAQLKDDIERSAEANNRSMNAEIVTRLENRTPTANIPPFGLRMQPELKAQIEEAARANNRSLNAEIVTRLAENPAGCVPNRLPFREASGSDQFVVRFSEKDDGAGPLQPEDKYTARFPDGMRDRLKELAEQNGRSMNSEIIARLADSINHESSSDAATLRSIVQTLAQVQRDVAVLAAHLKQNEEA